MREKITLHGLSSYYKDKILRQENIETPILSSLEFMGESIAIRTADGRHRLAGAKLAGVSIVFVRMSNETKTEIEMLLPGLIINHDLEHNKENFFTLTY
ncbi:MAG: hypothetical protein HKM04_01195 [Legionellales bacterium]|nr:hypothetical protein [Legionellales bacterium]